jgi:hypothetical protein
MIETWFPSVRRGGLERLASEHADALAMERGDSPPESDVAVERLMVNYLRHQHTDYDDDQTAQRHRAACEAIARRFPYLAEECARQIDRRAKEEAYSKGVLEELQRDAEERREQRAALIVASRTAITTLAVDQHVVYVGRGRDYKAQIIQVGRSRVTIRYHLKSGAERVKTVYAALVTPLPSSD